MSVEPKAKKRGDVFIIDARQLGGQQIMNLLAKIRKRYKRVRVTPILLKGTTTHLLVIGKQRKRGKGK